MHPDSRLNLWRRLRCLSAAVAVSASALAATDYSHDPALAQSEFTVSTAKPPFGELIVSIERQTPFRFSYSKDQVALETAVDLPAGRTSVAEAMKQSAVATGVGFRRIGRQIAIVPPGKETPRPTPRADGPATVLETST